MINNCGIIKPGGGGEKRAVAGNSHANAASVHQHKHANVAHLAENMHMHQQS
jgi:hypothetical protein